MHSDFAFSEIRTFKPVSHISKQDWMDTILLVGINGAIGKATAAFFADKGIHCLGTTSRRDILPDEKLFYLDLQDMTSTALLPKQLPQLNGIVFCAGYEPQRSLRDTDMVHHTKMMDVHVNGPLFVARSLRTKIQKNGAIIFISSVAARKGSYDPSYAIAKAAVEGMTRTLARELAPGKIRVNAIAPGLVKGTPVYKGMTADFRQNHLSQIPLGKLTTAEDCAEAIYFLYMQKQITGQIIHINGGQYFGN